MQFVSNERKIIITRIFLLMCGIALFFWWPLSHWFYPDVYHRFLGFVPGSYPGSMVKIIGTCGIVPVLLMFFAAVNPVRNKDSVVVIILFAALISMTYLYLIQTGAFPVYEYINVVFSVFTIAFLILFYPWKSDV